MSELKIRYKINKGSRFFKVGKARFKFTKFIISIDKNIHYKFKSTQGSKETFGAALKSSDILANIRIYALYREGMALVLKIEMFAPVGYILITRIRI